VAVFLFYLKKTLFFSNKTKQQVFFKMQPCVKVLRATSVGRKNGWGAASSQQLLLSCPALVFYAIFCGRICAKRKYIKHLF
jgi:hypothetical protein